MPSFEQTVFPTVAEVMDLVRSIVNDTFTGIAGTQGRIFTNDAKFTLPFLNSALRTIQRKLRNEGVTFPIKDGTVLLNLPPVVNADPAVFVNVGYNGYFNGQQTFGTIRLPSDCMQPLVVRQRQTGSNLQFVPMIQAQEGLASGYQNNWMGMWEWRGYAIWMNGSLIPTDLMLRYTTGQPPIDADPQDFDTTNINIIDCQDAVANIMAAKYGRARGASADQIKAVMDDANEAIDDMATEYVRRGQTVTYQRISYEGGGSNNQDNTSLGTTGTVN